MPRRAPQMAAGVNSGSGRKVVADSPTEPFTAFLARSAGVPLADIRPAVRPEDRKGLDRPSSFLTY